MHSELKWFLILLAILWLGWFATGGPDRIMTNRQNPFMEETYKGGKIYSLQELKDGTRP